MNTADDSECTNITESCGNVFFDLDFAPAEALNLQLRAALMAELRKMVQKSASTQVQIAEQLGITQSRVSDLVNGKFDRFSLDSLVNFAANLNCGIELKLKPLAI